MKETGILIDKPKHEKLKTARTPQNIAAVAKSVCEAPSTSIQSRSQQLNISETPLKRILHKNLGMTPHKVQLVQELKSIDHPMRFRFDKWACDRLTEDADFFKKKSSFQMKLISILAGMYTSKIVAIGAQKNPHAYIEKPSHPKRVTVWCVFWSRGIIGPFFFENEQGEAVTVNVDGYRVMLNEFLFTKIEEQDIDILF